jgi:hypothetical protein
MFLRFFYMRAIFLQLPPTFLWRSSDLTGSLITLERKLFV